MFRHGIVLVDQSHRIVHANSTAERILRARDGLHTRGGSVEADNAAADRALHRGIADAVYPIRIRSEIDTPRADPGLPPTIR
ncbi:hypothetical protein DMO24_24180 [Modestobacter versicolor]|uniref:PAS domain-containing protein n=1 Tax=Modestobacter versicolor TaxID=429133 RepID=A0A323V1U9_9ACTN|nr:hypothetical protein DMO24_24180 [Modestobacter versicolor]